MFVARPSVLYIQRCPNSLSPQYWKLIQHTPHENYEHNEHTYLITVIHHETNKQLPPRRPEVCFPIFVLFIHETYTHTLTFNDILCMSSCNTQVNFFVFVLTNRNLTVTENYIYLRVSILYQPLIGGATKQTCFLSLTF